MWFLKTNFRKCQAILTLLQISPIFLEFLIICLLWSGGRLCIILRYYTTDIIQQVPFLTVLNKGHVVYHSAKFFSERILKHKWVKEILYLFITWHWLHCISLRIIVYCYLACFWLVILTDITVFYICTVSLQALLLLSSLGNLLNIVSLVWIICQELCWCTTLTCPYHTGSISRQFFATPLNLTGL